MGFFKSTSFLVDTSLFEKHMNASKGNMDLLKRISSCLGLINIPPIPAASVCLTNPIFLG